MTFVQQETEKMVFQEDKWRAAYVLHDVINGKVEKR